jgi:hypothetical protein
MLGPWLAKARKLGGDATDCTGTVVGDLKCGDFMEWNARSQITTWKPIPEIFNGNILGGDGDYARKQWSGLVADYYATRVHLYTEQAISDATAKKSFDQKAMNAKLAKLAFEWQTSFGNGYPTEPVGDCVVESTKLISKWGHFFDACE